MLHNINNYTVGWKTLKFNTGVNYNNYTHVLCIFYLTTNLLEERDNENKTMG